ncbi:MAG TPA: hypothetical protein VEK15_28095, partial [Vicinamibacteria bacterium]|nr:hypothetical protein [Vicinamibacteria bacterium]
TVITFDRSLGERPEGVVLDRRGNLYVSLAPIGQILKLDADDPFPVPTLFAVLEPEPLGSGTLGLEVDRRGNVYAAVASFKPDSHGVWRITPKGKKSRLPGSEAIVFPNSLVFDERSNLYVTDTLGSAVWRIPPGGAAEVWASDVLLGGIPSVPGFPPLGANGITYHWRKLYVANSTRGQILKIRVRHDGSAGAVEPVTAGVDFDADGNLVGDFSLFPVDGIASDVVGNLYPLLVGAHKLVRLRPDGTGLTELAGPGDGLDFPASAAFGASRGLRTTVFITNLSITDEIDNPAVLKMDVGIPGPPVLGKD